MRTNIERRRRRLRRLRGACGTRARQYYPAGGASTPSNTTTCLVLPLLAVLIVPTRISHAAALSSTGSSPWPSLSAPGSLGGLLPPAVRIRIGGPSELVKLRWEVEDHLGLPRPAQRGDDGVDASTESSSDIHVPHLFWEEDAQYGWEVAESTFRVLRDQVTKMAEWAKKDGVSDRDDGRPCRFYVGFPSVKDPSLVEELAKTMRQMSQDLVGCACPPLELKEASVEKYPSCPAIVMRLSLLPMMRDDHLDGRDLVVEAESIGRGGDDSEDGAKAAPVEAAVASTEDWVTSFLSRYKLCPYTASLTKAAVGLDSVGVSAGPISVLAVPPPSPSAFAVPPALNLLNAFWSSVYLLLNTPEDELSTILLVDEHYDDDFASFCRACDDVVEPTVRATKSTEFVGRAWFHPRYAADDVGHREVVPGHAVPHSMVEKFVRDHTAADAATTTGAIPDGETLAKANDAVRRTPHATINILRRGQLEAAGRYEASLPADRRPRANEVYVRNALRLSSMILEGQNEEDG